MEGLRFMKCILCEQRKAKRSCPARDTQICAQCCGEKRVLEIDCPESCQYLIEGREWEAEDYRKRIQNLDQATLEKNRRVLREHQDVIAHLEYAISRQRILSRDLSDKDVEQAVDILLENYRTEDKGLLYEKNSDDLRVDSLRRELREIIESYRNPEGEEEIGIVDPKNTRLHLGAAIECLEFIRSLAMAYLKDRSSSSGYVDFLARIVPREEKRSSILMP
jgi:hypothetical protein